MRQLIKGTEIILYSGSNTETIKNVLIGQSSTTEKVDMSESGGQIISYTLAIPKGDNHKWSNRIVEFFGEKFRTVGHPLQGIEENIPTIWHKQVKVQKININGICTIYDSENYNKHIFENIYYNDNRGKIINFSGASVKGTLNCQIYADKFRQEKYIPKINDIVVIGESDFIFCATIYPGTDIYPTNTLQPGTQTQENISKSMRNFRSKNYIYGIIKEVKKINYGEICDYILTVI